MDCSKSVRLLDKKANQAPPLILAVEDDEDNQLLLKHTITMFGWRYIFTTNASEAVILAKQHRPNLILLDIVMPSIDGLQIAHTLRNHIATGCIPLIAVTGLSGAKERKLIYSAGFDDYLCKPYSLEDLRKAIFCQLQVYPRCRLA